MNLNSKVENQIDQLAIKNENQFKLIHQVFFRPFSEFKKNLALGLFLPNQQSFFGVELVSKKQK